MVSSATNLKLIFKPRSLALSYNSSPEIKEKKAFFVTKNNLATEKKNVRKKSFLAAEIDSETTV